MEIKNKKANFDYYIEESIECGIELKGTNAVVKVVEATQRPDIIKEDEYCNIIAT